MRRGRDVAQREQDVAQRECGVLRHRAPGRNSRMETKSDEGEQKEGLRVAMIQELELNASTVIIAVVVLVLFILALRVAARTWSGKRGCHGKESCSREDGGKNEGRS